MGRAIRETSRPIRCLWLKFRQGDESLVAAFRAFGEELVGSTTSISSLVFEGNVTTTEVRCLKGFLDQNNLRGIQFRRTGVDTSTFTELNPSFMTASNLKVVDLSSNDNLGDECIHGALNALLNGQARIETLNIVERGLRDGEPQANITRITGNEVVNIASFVSQSE